ncbi:MAG: Kae1-associated serine/threonine protein kinase [Thermoplasmata archaeon]|nr:MAG: Kae1-associated serine/threonine protein kinase [Thermoplasmata archaeon]
MELIKRGAEAKIYRAKWMGKEVVIKRRIRKGYRIKELDEEIRRRRTKEEAFLMAETRRAGVSVPIIYYIDTVKMEIVMEYIGGKRIKDFIDDENEETQKKICRMIGESVAKMHSHGIIHGDLTTSNMILADKLYFIDFGLGMKSFENEARGVDMHLLMEAFNAAHRNEKLFKWVFEAYEENFDEADEVKRKIDEIIKRGRYMRRVS